MIRIRKSDDRHHEDFGWLETWWSFSFDTYYDPEHTAFGPLRVLNEDYIRPGTGFPTHAHREMEILTFVLEGAVEHEDSLGNRTIIRAGEGPANDGRHGHPAFRAQPLCHGAAPPAPDLGLAGSQRA